MLKVNKQLPSFRVGPKMGPKGISPVEQKIWRMGYRCCGEKIMMVKVSNKMTQKVRERMYFRGKKCIRVGDILENIRLV